MVKRRLAFFLTVMITLSGVCSSNIETYASEIHTEMEQTTLDESGMEENASAQSEIEDVTNDSTARNIISNDEITDNEGLELGEVDSEEDDPEESNPESGDHANSFRYSDGQKLMQFSLHSVRPSNSFHPNATKTGIDVSKWNKTIDWEKVKADGIDFAIIRCGYGSDLIEQDDAYFLRNVTECERLGIPYGVYIYSYAKNTESALSEANHVLRLIAGHKLTYPVYFDMEDISTTGCDLAAIAQTFCSTIQDAGYAVGVYSSTNWWNTYLTSPVFSQWYRWVAQYNTSCKYTGTYAMWQYSSKGRVAGITGDVDMNYLIGNPSDHGGEFKYDISDDVGSVLQYSAHVSDIGWMDELQNGQVSGDVGKNRQLEAVKINLQNVEGVRLEYQTYTTKEGWSNPSEAGEIAGSVGENKPLEAIKIKLSGEQADQYQLYYRVYVKELGWLDWAENNMAAGTSAYGYTLQAYQIILQEKNSEKPGDTEVPFRDKNTEVNLSMRAHVSDIGWQGYVKNGSFIGTTGKGKGVEAYQIRTDGVDIGVRYTSRYTGEEWQEWSSSGNTSGTVGQSKTIEAVKMEMTGANKALFDVYYRVHVANIGWLDWTANGEAAGTDGYGYPIEAIQVQVVLKESSDSPQVGDHAYKGAPINLIYAAHVQDIGWQQSVNGGEVAGTIGRAKKVEALKVRITNSGQEDDLEYRAYVEGTGWQEYAGADHIAGTVGKNKRIEAISIRLKEKLNEDYDIYYRVHCSDFGWLGWTKNGESSGTIGYDKSIEAIQITLVDKGSAAPGSIENAFIAREATVSYRAHVQDIGWQKYIDGDGIAGTTGKSKQLEALRIRLDSPVHTGAIVYSTHVSDIGWQSEVKNGELAGTVGKNKSIEAVTIRLTGIVAEEYDVYYRVHSSDYGWLGWAKNGEKAGTEGLGKKAEAIQIKLVAKGQSAPEETGKSFIKR